MPSMYVEIGENRRNHFHQEEFKKYNGKETYVSPLTKTAIT